jgi:hypothetical protein
MTEKNEWIATAKFLRESVNDAEGNWAEIPIDILLDIAELLEGLNSSETT